MKKMTLALGVGALALVTAGGAIAQQAMKHDRAGMMRDPRGTATITRAEAQAKAAEIFTRLDANKDGKLSEADREARRAERVGAAFNAVDTNKDGRIDQTEFAAHHAQPGMGMGGGMGRRGGMGRGDGPGRGAGMGAGMGGRMIGAMDTNNDKAISRDEFLAGALKRFDGADANKDGKVTPEERRTAIRQMRGPMPAPAPTK